MANEAQLKNFFLIDDFSKGYRNKEDVVSEEPGVAVSGSKNVWVVDNKKVGNRPGFSYLGSRSTDRYGILDGGSWKTSTAGTEFPIRTYSDGTNGIVEVYAGSTWLTLIDSIATQGASFLNNGAGVLAGWWSSTEGEDLLLFVDGSDNIYMWSGGYTTFSSATINTVTCQGSDTWGEQRFLTAGSRSIRVLDDGGTWREVSYTGGEGTTTLTGTGDLTGFAISAGQPVLQVVRTTANKPAADLSNDFIAKYLNYLFVFDRERNTIQMSKNTDYTDFSAPASPRNPGEAASFNLDETPTAAITQPDGEALYISTRNRWYQFIFTPSADLADEKIDIQPLKNSLLEGATNNLAITNMKNYTVFTSGEPTIDNLGRVENIDTPQSVPLSDPIKNYMDSAGVTTSSNAYYKNNFYTTLREDSTDSSNNRILIRNLRLGSWEAPWTIPASVMFEYSGDLYCHDPSTKNTYKLLDSNYADNFVTVNNQAPIDSLWYSAYLNYGYPFNQKEFSVMWVDGYIRANTELDIIINYDFGQETFKRTLKGTLDEVVIVQTGGGLGYYSLGNRSLGGRGETLSETGLRRFRGFIPVPKRPFYEMQFSFQSSGAGYRWEIVRCGFNIIVEKSQDYNLKIT